MRMHAMFGLTALGTGHDRRQAILDFFYNSAGGGTAGKATAKLTCAAGALDQIADFKIKTMGPISI